MIPLTQLRLRHSRLTNCWVPAGSLCESRYPNYARSRIRIKIFNKPDNRPYKSKSRREGNMRPARLCHAVRVHNCKVCIYYKKKLHKNLRNILWFKSTRPVKQPIIMAVAFCHKCLETFMSDLNDLTMITIIAKLWPFWTSLTSIIQSRFGAETILQML